MTDHDININREIGEALRAQGIDGDIAGEQIFVCEAEHWRKASEQTCRQPMRDPAGLRPHCGAVVHPRLIPHDFGDPRYLFPALEAWIGDREIQVSAWRWSARAAHHIGGKWGSQILQASVGLGRYNGDGDTITEALREAFHATLKGGAK